MSQLILSQLPFLRRIASRWQQRAADRDDLVQDTLVRSLANAHLWQPGSNLRAWLVTIMRNQFLASLAKSGRAADAQRIYADVQSQISLGDSTARLMLRDVNRALHRMPNAQRQAITLVGLEAKSYTEVARAMGITTDAVRSHLARARQYLRDAVGPGRTASPISTRNGCVPRRVSVK
jgi:RNA polymerase sigma-70 factor (ECF subfamily)